MELSLWQFSFSSIKSTVSRNAMLKIKNDRSCHTLPEKASDKNLQKFHPWLLYLWICPVIYVISGFSGKG